MPRWPRPEPGPDGRDDVLGRGRPTQARRPGQYKPWQPTTPARIVLSGDIHTRLLVEPPWGQPEFLRDVPGFFQHDSVGNEQGIDITRHTRGIVGQGHRSAADDEHVRDEASAYKPLTQGSEGPLKLCPAKQNASGLAHAASRSLTDR